MLRNTIPAHDLTVRDVANLCNLSERAVREYISRGLIPSYKVGSSRRIPAEAVEKLRGGQLTNDFDAVIDTIVAAAPELSDEQRNRISALLRVGGGA